MMLFFWLLLYGLLYTVSSQIHIIFHLKSEFTGWVMLGYLLCLLAWIYKTGSARNLGLTIPAMEKPGAYGNLAFLCVLPVYNILMSSGWEADLSQMLLMLAAAVCEELFFRGFLFHSLLKKTVHGAWITSCVFALAHGVNYLHTGDRMITTLQILCAFAASLHYCASTIYYRSITPAIAAHILVNLSGVCTIPMDNHAGKYGLLLCMAVHIWCGIQILKKEENEKRNTE